MPHLTYDKDSFYLDGKPFRILSGAMHYFRTVPEYWEDRLRKLKAMGLNTVETYMCWNLHERREGVFDFTGILDISRFIGIAESLDLNVILRPGPYICAEWDFGGLPSWLQKYPSMRLRCADPLYLEKVKRYLKAVVDEIAPHLESRGGRVIMVQVENEYGSYGCDKTYLRAIADYYRSLGVDCALFTSDGPCWAMLGGGTLDGLLSVTNFGSGGKGSFDLLKKFRPDQPVMCGEFWNGWFDHWYENHHTRDPKEAAEALDEVLGYGEDEEHPSGRGNVNLYMFHGGTNFAFTNGANHGGKYEPTITSYDYDSPLSEAGDLTPKYYSFKEKLELRFGPAPALEVSNTPKAAYGRVELTESAPLLPNVPALAVASTKGKYPTKGITPFAYPLWMEELDQDFGYTLYSVVAHGPFEEGNLHISQLHDRAHIFINGEFKGIKERDRRNDEIKLGLGVGESARIDILVENMGRVNYGGDLGYNDKKGIFAVHLGTYLSGFTMYPLPMEDLSPLKYSEGQQKVPAFFRGTLKIDGTPADTFLDMAGFEKGFVLVNGHNLGRYFNAAGPQKTLYCPAPWLREGDNEIVVFETDCVNDAAITFTDTPKLG